MSDAPKKTNMSETSKNEFSMAVERKAVESNIPFLTALTEVMVECAIEPKKIAKMINKSLKEKIEKEAMDNRMIKNPNKVVDLDRSFTS